MCTQTLIQTHSTTPRAVLARQYEYLIEMETSCDDYFRDTAPQYYEDTRKAIGELVNADPSDIAMVENATSGVNSVLRSLQCIHEGKDVYFLYFNIAYGMLKQVLFYLRDTYKNVHLIEVVLDHDSISSHEKLIAKVENVLEQHANCNIVLAVVEHISSIPTIVFPVKQLHQIFKQRNILSLVDGAHTVGQIPIDIRDLDVDYYVSNCHKWLYAPKSASFLYIRRELKQFTRPAFVSFGYENRDFTYEYFWAGTRDLSPMFSVVKAIEWRKEIGGEQLIMNYCNDLAFKAAERVAQIWDTSVLIDAKNRSVMNAAMVNVEVPSSDGPKLDAISKKMMREHRAYVHFFEFDGKWYARFSANVYNELEDYEKVATKILELLN
jgi:selenocysteine lyase/cysteine desulfurase